MLITICQDGGEYIVHHSSMDFVVFLIGFSTLSVHKVMYFPRCLIQTPAHALLFSLQTALTVRVDKPDLFVPITSNPTQPEISDAFVPAPVAAVADHKIHVLEPLKVVKVQGDGVGMLVYQPPKSR